MVFNQNYHPKVYFCLFEKLVLSYHFWNDLCPCIIEVYLLLFFWNGEFLPLFLHQKLFCRNFLFHCYFGNKPIVLFLLDKEIKWTFMIPIDDSKNISLAAWCEYNFFSCCFKIFIWSPIYERNQCSICSSGMYL